MTVEEEMKTALGTDDSHDLQFLIRMVDECLAELGTASLVDGRSARDKLLDIRHFIMELSTVKKEEDS